MKRRFTGLITLLLGGALISACLSGIPVSGDPESLRATHSAATLTLLAEDMAVDLATQNALQTEVSLLRTQVQQQPQVIAQEPTAVPLSPTLTFTPNVSGADAPEATATTPPTPIPPAPTATRLPCNIARFVADVTIPDGTVFSPGTAFTKIWRLQNMGACTWTTDYTLAFVSGSAMGGPIGLALPGTVLPGQVIDLSVNLITPLTAGSYRSYWKLRDSSGALFGLGMKGDPFYVDIVVEGSESQTPLDFAASYCAAGWTSGAGALTCPGELNDSRGFVRLLDKPTLENGYIEDAPTLLTNPQMITNGIIRGKYPAVTVGPTDHFAAVIGCAYRADSCDVIFQLDYQIGDGTIQNLAAWRQVYDGQYDLVDIDLNPLAGQDVNFILTIIANGSSTQNRALWLAPHIARR